ncbi:hypothetical protein BGZ76_007756, partial [Entomortierella beljakovae]
MLNLELANPAIPVDLLLIPSSLRPWRWQDFETLLPYYQKVLIKALMGSDDRRSLSEIFRGAKGNKDLLNRRVILQDKDVYWEKKQCLHTKKTTLELGDIECLLGEDTTISRQQEDGLFLCKKNTASLDCRWIMQSEEGKPFAIFVQTKHSELETTYAKFNREALESWYNCIDKAIQDYENGGFDVVIVV